MPFWTPLIPLRLRQRFWRQQRRRKLRERFGVQKAKYLAELSFWQRRWEQEGRVFRNEHFERLFLAMAGEQDHGFIRGKIVADFGCGPRGSLCWAQEARARIGIDVLADAYAQFNIRAQDMVYICSTERRIPLPSRYVDVLLTINVLDHVDDFAGTCRELLRILAPGGLLIASLNLGEPATVCEPQSLTAEDVQAHLLRHLLVLSYRTAPRGPDEAPYRYMLSGVANAEAVASFLWVKAQKP